MAISAFKGRILIGLTVSCFGAFEVPAGETDHEAMCSGAVYIHAEDRRLDPAICDAVAKVRKLTSDCGLDQTRSIIVNVVREMDEQHETCAAYFDCTTDEITILAPNSLAASDDILIAFRNLPMDEYFQSVIVHELTHAFVHQSQDGRFSRVAHEYLAYATQIASLTEKSRTSVLESSGVEETATLDSLDEIALFFGPSHFALLAFKHFAHPENGCAFVDRMILADPTLPEAFRRNEFELTPWWSMPRRL